MNDTLKMLADSTLHTAEEILHGVPGEGSDLTQWAGWGIAGLILLWNLFNYFKKMRKPKP